MATAVYENGVKIIEHSGGDSVYVSRNLRTEITEDRYPKHVYIIRSDVWPKRSEGREIYAEEQNKIYDLIEGYKGKTVDIWPPKWFYLLVPMAYAITMGCNDLSESDGLETFAIKSLVSVAAVWIIRKLQFMYYFPNRLEE